MCTSELLNACSKKKRRKKRLISNCQIVLHANSKKDSYVRLTISENILLHQRGMNKRCMACLGNGDPQKVEKKKVNIELNLTPPDLQI